MTPQEQQEFVGRIKSMPVISNDLLTALDMIEAQHKPCARCGSHGECDADFHCAMCYGNLEEKAKAQQAKLDSQAAEIKALLHRHDHFRDECHRLESERERLRRAVVDLAAYAYADKDTIFNVLARNKATIAAAREGLK